MDPTRIEKLRELAKKASGQIPNGSQENLTPIKERVNYIDPISKIEAGTSPDRPFCQDRVEVVKGDGNKFDYLLLLADGSGDLGHAVSRNSVDYAKEILEERIPDQSTGDLEGILEQAVEDVNTRLVEDARCRQYGGQTTFDCVVVKGDEYFSVHVGDGRVYKIGNDIKQLTEDHALARGALSSALGWDSVPFVQTYRGKLDPGDIMLMASDGTYKRGESSIEEEKMSDIFGDVYDNEDLNGACDNLYKEAMRLDNGDDKSIIAVGVKRKDADIQKTKKEKKRVKEEEEERTREINGVYDDLHKTIEEFPTPLGWGGDKKGEALKLLRELKKYLKY